MANITISLKDARMLARIHPRGMNIFVGIPFRVPHWGNLLHKIKSIDNDTLNIVDTLGGGLNELPSSKFDEQMCSGFIFSPVAYQALRDEASAGELHKVLDTYGLSEGELRHPTLKKIVEHFIWHTQLPEEDITWLEEEEYFFVLANYHRQRYADTRISQHIEQAAMISYRT